MFKALSIAVATAVTRPVLPLLLSRFSKYVFYGCNSHNCEHHVTTECCRCCAALLWKKIPTIKTFTVSAWSSSVKQWLSTHYCITFLQARWVPQPHTTASLPSSSSSAFHLSSYTTEWCWSWSWCCNIIFAYHDSTIIHLSPSNMLW